METPIDRTDKTENFETDRTSWRLGPFHPALPGPLAIDLDLDGELIVRAAVERGYLHRGLEKSMELNSWIGAISYADRVDPECAVFGECALTQAVEEILSIEVPVRAQMIRVIVCELSRVASHFRSISRIAEAVGAETASHYVLRDREKILDLFELLMGARFTFNFFRYGGVAADVTEGFLERVLEVCDLVRIRLKEYNDILSFNRAFLKRTTGIGVLSSASVKRHGITGPNARAAGMLMDVRKDHPYAGYERYDFRIPSGLDETGISGDCHSRFLIRLREIHQSLEILRECVETMASGPFSIFPVSNDFSVRAGEAYSRVESPRGLMGCYVVSEGKEKPARIGFTTPSSRILDVISELLVGSRVEDMPVILASLDFSVAEADR